jgi:hypothetical protein
VISVISVIVTTALVLFLLLKDDLLDEPVDERPVVGWGAADVYYGNQQTIISSAPKVPVGIRVRNELGMSRR